MYSGRDTIIIPPPQASQGRNNESACLVIISGNPIGKVFFLEKENIIGRSEEDTVYLADPSISRIHAKLNFHEGQWQLQDMGSSNGTHVNFSKITEKILQGGETLTVGATSLKFLVANKIEKDFYERVFNMTSKDALTEAFTKSFLLEIVASEFARALLHQKPLSFCMMDLDNFKNCNDQYGHLAGDFILKEWINLLRQSIRSSDILGRFGGEEFGLLLPNQTLAQAEQTIKRLMQKTHGHTFTYEGEVISITFSAGLSTLEPQIHDFENLLKKADENLYKAKAKGRNCYVSR